MEQNKIVTRSAYMRATTAEMKKNRQAEFVISTESVDSYNTVFKSEGWDIRKYKKNPIVAYQHRTFSEDPDNIIGTSKIRFDNKEMIAIITFEDAETNPKAEKVMRKVHNGTLNMASVGFKPIEYRYGVKADGEDPKVLYFTKTELREWSIVTEGSNPDALKRNEEVLNNIRTEIANNQTSTPVIPDEESQTNKRSAFEAQILINNNK